MSPSSQFGETNPISPPKSHHPEHSADWALICWLKMQLTARSSLHKSAKGTPVDDATHLAACVSSCLQNEGVSYLLHEPWLRMWYRRLTLEFHPETFIVSGSKLVMSLHAGTRCHGEDLRYT